MTFGKRLRELRKARNISQRDLASRVNVDFTYISKIEAGSNLPPSDFIIHRIAQTLDVDENELFCCAGKVPSGLKVMLRNNPLLVELVRVLSSRVLPDKTYRDLLALALSDEN